jgi:GT2 family glycosyltransferase
VKVTLIMGSLGSRPDELERFLGSLGRAHHPDIELIVVDQSPDGRLRPLLSRHQGSGPWVHLRSEPGLSRARNVGMQRATGDILTFPDDDCWYPDTLLSRVVERFRRDPSLGALLGHPVDAEGRSAFPRWDLREGWVNRYNVWRRSNSNALFVRREVATRIGGFDETLGIGSGTPWGAAEDIDYPLRVLAAGVPVYYDPSIQVHHPRVIPHYESDRTRAQSYAAGMGRVLRKAQYPWWFVGYQLLRPAGGVALSLASARLHKARYHFGILSGRFKGWIAR